MSIKLSAEGLKKPLTLDPEGNFLTFKDVKEKKPALSLTALLTDFDFVVKIRKGIVRVCLPVIIAQESLEEETISAYDIIKSCVDRYDVHLSPGTVYPVLFSLERAGDIKKILNLGKARYYLSKKGKRNLAQFHIEVGSIQKIFFDLANF